MENNQAGVELARPSGRGRSRRRPSRSRSASSTGTAAPPRPMWMSAARLRRGSRMASTEGRWGPPASGDARHRRRLRPAAGLGRGQAADGAHLHLRLSQRAGRQGLPPRLLRRRPGGRARWSDRRGLHLFAPEPPEPRHGRGADGGARRGRGLRGVQQRHGGDLNRRPQPAAARRQRRLQPADLFAARTTCSTKS